MYCASTYKTQEFENYQVDQCELERVIKKLDKVGRMINATDVVVGKEFIKDVQCGICAKIATTVDIKECSLCKTIICDQCVILEKISLEDKFLDCENQNSDGGLMTSIQAYPDCPACKK